MPDDDPDDPTPKLPPITGLGSASGRAPDGELPPLAVRIERARQAADQRRRELGLPEHVPDELELMWEARWSEKGPKRRR